MPSYLDAVKARLAELQNKNQKSEKKDEKSKVNFFKPEIGKEYVVRFLPYLDKNNQPFEEVLYYNNINKVLSPEGKEEKRRMIAPFQYGLPDPIADFLTEMQKDTKGRTPEAKEVWLEWNSQRAKPRFYALMIVRGEEDKGPQIMEMSNDECVKAYTAFTHMDLVEEDVFHPETGHDFILTCAADSSGKQFKGRAVRSLTFQGRMKATKLGTKAQMETWLKMMPELNLHDYFKKMVSNEEKCKTILENYINGGSKADSSSEGTGTDHNATRGVANNTEADKAIDEAFADIG